jgi:lysozyme
MPLFIPKNRPQQDRDWVVCELNKFLKKEKALDAWDGKELIIFGMEGYFLDSMGGKGKNDRSIVDDAIALISGDFFAIFNANLDPNGYRPGHGHGGSKGMGSIHYGVHRKAYQIGKHKSIYPALRQVGEIIVRRDADHNVPKKDLIFIDNQKYYLEVGSHQAMNHHPMGPSSTSSIGCQTLPIPQWPEYIGGIVRESKRLGQRQFTYVKARVRG